MVKINKEIKKELIKSGISLIKVMRIAISIIIVLSSLGTVAIVLKAISHIMN